MHKSHLEYLICPACKSALAIRQIASEVDDRIETGLLACEQCKAKYPIIRFIPRFVPQNNYASSFGFQWLKHARTQFDSSTGSKVSEDRFFKETRWERDLKGELLLEVGSGSGRFTEHAVTTGAMVISLDYSVAVEANYASNGQHPNLLIVQGDIYQMPFRESAFDKVMCIGVLQHTPDVERAFFSLVPCLKPGGKLVVDIYAKASGILGSLRHLFKTRYWVRPLVRSVRKETLYRYCERYVNLTWRLSGLVNKIPRMGNRLNWFFLIPDYRGHYPLPESTLKEWAVLDLFDILSPQYDQPQTIETVRRWFQQAKFTAVDVHYGYNGIEGRGVKT